MDNVNFQTLLEQVQKLSPVERLRLMELLSATLQTEFVGHTDWHAALKATYGILADDPIERPPQPVLEERDPTA